MTLSVPGVVAQDEVYVNMGPYLALFDPSTCTYTMVTEMDLAFGDIALTPNGELYGISSNTIHNIHLDGSLELVVTLPPPLNGVSLVALDNDHLLFESWDSLFVVAIDGSSLQSLGYLGYSASGDLTWYDGDLYMSAGWDALIHIQLNDEFTAVTSVDSIDVMATGFGEVYGVVTIPGVCNPAHQMIAFDVWDVYLVDPATAQTSMLCPNAFPYGVAGAATYAETSSSIAIPLIEQENVFTPNGDGINDVFLPAKNDNSTIRSFQIIDRWGLTMHSTSGKIPWDGRSSDGHICPEGVYYYVIEAHSKCDNSFIVSRGHVSILR
jgi:gliding motility-associated-like protein